MSANIVIVIYSLYGHITSLAEEIQSGLEAAGCDTTLCRAPELLSDEMLEEMGAEAPDDTIPICQMKDLIKADGIIFGISARFGMASAQLKSLWDSTGQLWAEGALVGKTAGIFVSTGTQGGGQETVPLSWITQLAHQGMIYIPSGYTDPSHFIMDEVKGGTPYGPGTFAGFEGDRELSDIEKSIAKNHGNNFATITTSLKMGREVTKSDEVEEGQEIIPQVIEAVQLQQETEQHIETINIATEEKEILSEETKEHAPVAIENKVVEVKDEEEEEEEEVEEEEEEVGEKEHEPEAESQPLPEPVLPSSVPAQAREETEPPVEDVVKTSPNPEETETKEAENSTEANTAKKSCCLIM